MKKRRKSLKNRKMLRQTRDKEQNLLGKGLEPNYHQEKRQRRSR